MDVYDNNELMEAFFPMFPIMWDETDERSRWQSMDEDFAYYESFE